MTDAATKELHDYVSSVKVLPEVRMEYMMWEEMIFYEKRDAKEEEIAELLDLPIEEVQAVIIKNNSEPNDYVEV